MSEEWRALGSGAVAVRTAWTTPGADGTRRASVRLRRLDSKLSPTGDELRIYDGPPVLTALAVRDGAAGIVLFRGGAGTFVKLAIADLASGAVRVVDLRRTAPAGYSPTTAVVCGDADGFTVVWQEQKTTDPRADVHTTMARVGPSGVVLSKPAAVAIPWSVAAIVDDGRGYTLAVNYDGAAPDQTRLCFVTLSRTGSPEQHPWWGTRPSVVDDVQLVNWSGKVIAVYRGGPDGRTIASVTVAKEIGQWGKDPEPSRTLATNVSPGEPFTLRGSNRGGIDIVIRPR